MNKKSASSSSAQFPPFPSEIIEGLAKRFVDLYSPIRETPDEFLWLAFMTYFGNAISPYVSLDSAGSEPRIYAVTIGESGRTRKSAGNNAAKELFREVQHTSQQRIKEGFGSAEGLLNALEKQNNACYPTIVHLDEINILATKTKMQGTVGISALNKLFEDHECDHDTATRGSQTVRNAYVSIIGASTLEDFTKTWTGQHKDTGFFNRLLLVAAEAGHKRFPTAKPPDPALLQILVTDVTEAIAALRKQSITLKMDSDAESLWGLYYDTFGDGEEWTRIDTYGTRLMVIQAVLQEEKSVTKANVQKVIDFLNYEVAVRRSVMPVVAENLIAQVEELIRRHVPEGYPMTKREIQRKINYQRYGIETFDRALANLRKNGEIVIPHQDGKSLKYMRVREEDVVEDVIENTDDTSVNDKTVEMKHLEAADQSCHQNTRVVCA